MQLIALLFVAMFRGQLTIGLAREIALLLHARLSIDTRLSVHS